MIKSPLALLVLALCTPSWGALYKWVDDKGVTHYEETPPSGKKAQELRVESPPPSGGNTNAPANKDWQEQEREFLRRRLERKEAEEARNAEKMQAEAKREKCQRAQRRLYVLSLERPVYTVNEQGERVYWEDSARQAGIEDAKKAVAAFCSQP